MTLVIGGGGCGKVCLRSVCRVWVWLSETTAVRSRTCCTTSTSVIGHPRVVYTRYIAIGVHTEIGVIGIGREGGREGAREIERGHCRAARSACDRIVHAHTTKVRAIAHPGESKLVAQQRRMLKPNNLPGNLSLDCFRYHPISASATSWPWSNRAIKVGLG